MKPSARNRLGIALILVCLFALSVAVRRPLFGKEFTASHEWLSAHTLITAQLWSSVPSAVHHYNLLYTFPEPANKFIDDLWAAGVPDRFGNYYYVSMPHLAFFTPFLFIHPFQAMPTIQSLEIFGLCLHFLTAILLFGLMRQLTKGQPGSRIASVGAFCFVLFASTSLYYFQNAIVGTVLVLPYTILLLLSVTALLNGARRFAAAAWALLFVSVLIGCLTDWQAYFTAFSATMIAFVLAIGARNQRRIAIGIMLTCCMGVCLAIAITVLQDSRIAGFPSFQHAILGRLKVRSGGEGQGIASAFYYRQLARFYAAYLPFLLLGGVLWLIAARRRSSSLPALWSRAKAPLAIAGLAVLTDHIVLANHTAVHIFTTLNGIVPLAILLGIAIVGYLQSSVQKKRDHALIGGALMLCIAASCALYLSAYRNRPHPFRATASAITAVARPTDVIFATGRGFAMKSDFIVPQMLFYLRRNVEVVTSEQEAALYLRSRSLRRGVLAVLNPDSTLAGLHPIELPR